MEDSGLDSECPLHCGTCPDHLMTACCVVIDITDRCNQHCPYCFARADETAAADPPLETIKHWYRRLRELGEERPFNIQLSGGEPTVRNDLPEIIRAGREMGFEYIQLNTNGRRIALEDGYAEMLAEAGLTTVFLQFDGTTDAIHIALRGEALMAIKEKAIDHCNRAGLPVTLVPTVVAGINLDNVGDMIEFMLDRVHAVKGIHFQPVSFFGRHPDMVSDNLPRATMFSVMDAVEFQTDGRICAVDLLPISTGHPLCCFCGTFLKGQDGLVTSLATQEAKEEGISCCCTDAPLDIVRKDRDFVLNKWSLGPSSRPKKDAQEEGRDPGSSNDPEAENGNGESERLLSFDEAIALFRRNMFTISGMAFMDIANLDAARLKRCRVQVWSEDERLIPFCAYNSLYRV